MFGTPAFLSLLFLLSPLHVFASTEKACYAPDGRVADNTYQPCIAINGVHSMCCSLNTTTPDTCQPNGLCLSNSANEYKSNYWRDFCTDKTWESPNCLSKTLCDDDAGGNSDWTSRVTICDNGSYCCGTDQTCCSGTTFTLKPTLVAIGNTTAATATTTVTATGSGVSDNPGPSKVAIGAGVGVPLALLAIAMLGAGFIWGRRNTQAKYNSLPGGINRYGGHPEGYVHPDGYVQAHPLSQIAHADSKAIHEVSAGPVGPSELAVTREPRAKH